MQNVQMHFHPLDKTHSHEKNIKQHFRLRHCPTTKFISWSY